MSTQHGWNGCRQCFVGGEGARFTGRGNPPQWRLECNPASWGCAEPEVMVLGFSKGARQCRSLPFDQIPFAGAWRNLTKILQAVYLLQPDDRVEWHFRADESRFQFGSLIRCSVARWDSGKGEYSKSGGSILKRFLKDPDCKPISLACRDRFLGELSTRTRLVIMLGNDDEYITLCRELMTGAHSRVEKINAVAYGNEQVRWVHLVHPMAQGRHVPDWLAGGETALGRKLGTAQEAVLAAGLHHQVTWDQPPGVGAIRHRSPPAWAPDESRRAGP